MAKSNNMFPFLLLGGAAILMLGGSKKSGSSEQQGSQQTRPSGIGSLGTGTGTTGGGIQR